MSNIINADNGVVSGIAGVKLSSDSTGVLDIQTNGTTAITISTAQVVSLTNSPTFTGGTANGVLYLNASKVATSGSALVFDGTNLLGVGTNGTPSHGVKGIVTANSGNASALQLTNNTGSGSVGGSIIYAASGDDFAVYTFTGAIGSETYALRYNIASGGASHRWNVGASEAMRLNATGLGIGTSSPGYKLTVQSAIDTYAFNIRDTIGNERVLIGSRATAPIDNITPVQMGNDNAGNLFLSSRTNTACGINFYTNAGTAAALRATIDSSGNLGIGTTSPGSILEVKTAAPLITLSASAYTNQYQTTLGAKSGADAYLIFGNNGLNEIRAGRTNTGGYLDFYTNNTVAQASASDGNFVMRLSAAGDLLVGTTAVPNVGITGQFGFSVSSSEVVISKSGADGLIIRTTSAASNNIRLYNLNNQVGSVSTTTTATAYNTSSDYRLKNTIAPITGALAKVALLKPCTYKWNDNGSDGQGFIAHELAEVVPDCVTGEKDAVDSEGKPQYQGVDTSFLVATLTAAIQEQQAIITQLTARITVLEGT